MEGQRSGSRAIPLGPYGRVGAIGHPGGKRYCAQPTQGLIGRRSTCLEVSSAWSGRRFRGPRDRLLWVCFSPSGPSGHLPMNGEEHCFEELVADGAADDELGVRMAPARRAVDDPLRTMHEAQMFRQVVAELSEVVEWDAMPETAGTPALEQSVAHHARDRQIRRSVVRKL